MNRDVLIIEDDPSHRELIIRSMAGNPDYQVDIRFAGTLLEAGESIRTKIPDLVLADLNLPDGQATTLLGGVADRAPYPMIVMTSLGDEQTAVNAIKAGAIDYLTKSPELFREIPLILARTLLAWTHIQERRKAEAALHDNQVYLNTIFNSVNDAIFIQDSDTAQITDVNESACRLYGYTREELKNLSIGEISSGTPPYDQTHALIKMTESRSGDPQTFEWEARRKSGELFWVEVSIRFGVLGRENCYFVSVRDMTERKQSEQQLIEARKKAEESDRLKTAFLANMSHEIRTPMNGIIGFSEMLVEGGLTDEEQKQFSRIIRNCGSQLLSIIDDLIDLAKIEQNLIRISPESADLSELARDLVSLHQERAAEKGLVLTGITGLKGTDAMVMADANRIRQVMTNLIGNAIKFTHAGEIRFGFDRRDRMLEFFVEDTGIGIPRDKQYSVFERFRQADENISSQYGGSGLGLAIAKALVELMGGAITIDPDRLIGTAIRFTIPFVPVNKPNRQDAEAHGDQTAAATGGLILVAEDDDVNRLLYDKILTRENRRLLFASNGLEAVELVRRHPEIELVLMDIKMPVLDGLTATREIKKIRPSLPVIIQSAYAQTSDIEEARNNGCDGYLTKPVTKEKLLALIREYP
jgi:PAS domain S-box-containing protein